MPELPEVETIRRSLEKRVIGRVIEEIYLLNPTSFHGDPLHARSQKILKVIRKAKVLGIELTQDFTLLIHLKMSGQVIFKKQVGKVSDVSKVSGVSKGESFIGGHPTKDMAGEMPNKSTRVIFRLDDGSQIFFNDQRKFGWVKLIHSEDMKLNKFLNSLGPEPLEEGFTWEILKKNLLKHKKSPVKVNLLDQSVVSGIGNIYACEACFLAGVDPRIKVADLTDAQFKKLYSGIIESLKNGIKYGGSSKTHFVDAEGKKGLFLDYAFVYGRDKKPCKKCGTLIEKIKLGGRGTFFCQVCQR